MTDLPEPHFGKDRYLGHAEHRDAYTTTQMIEYRNQALEEAAKVCESGAHNATEWDSAYWDQCCNNRAAAIRALIGEVK